MKKWYVVNAYSARNAGDAAITLGTARVAADADGARVHIASRYSHQDVEFYRRHGISCGPPPITFPVRGPRESNGTGRVVLFLVSLVVSVLLAATYRASPKLAGFFLRIAPTSGLREMLNADRVVIAGGGYLYSSRRRLNLSLFHCLVCMLLPVLAGKATLMMPQSVGPASHFDRILIRLVLRKVGGITVRDLVSLKFVHDELRISDVSICPDAAFALGETESQPACVASKPTVGVVAMDWSWSRSARECAMARYVSHMAMLVEQLNRKGYAVVLLASSRVGEQRQDDLEIGQQVAEQARRQGAADVMVVETLTVDEFIGALREVHVVVGTRLHACILAIAHGKAAVAIGYQPKTEGTYRLLSLGQYAHDVETFDPARISAQVEELIAEPSRTSAFEIAGAHARADVLAYYRKRCGQRSH